MEGATRRKGFRTNEHEEAEGHEEKEEGGADVGLRAAHIATRSTTTRGDITTSLTNDFYWFTMPNTQDSNYQF